MDTAVPDFQRAAESFEKIYAGAATHSWDRSALIDAYLKLSNALVDIKQPEQTEAPLRRTIAICEEFYTTQNLSDGEDRVHWSAANSYSKLFRLLKEKGGHRRLAFFAVRRLKNISQQVRHFENQNCEFNNFDCSMLSLPRSMRPTSMSPPSQPTAKP
jgi:hypothetical protein